MVPVLNAEQAKIAYAAIQAIRHRPHNFTNRQRKWGTRSYKWYISAEDGAKVVKQLARQGIDVVYDGKNMPRWVATSIRFYTADENKIGFTSNSESDGTPRERPLTDKKFLRQLAVSQPDDVARRIKLIANKL